MQEPNSLQIGTAREILDDTIPGGSRIVYWNGEFWTPILRIGLRRSIPDASEPNGHRLEYWTGKQWTNRLIHGVKIALYPTPEQAAKFNCWQNRVRSLWNLLLDIEKAAYSGEPFRPELHWRPIWAEVVQKNHEIALKDWTYGKKVRMGKNKGMEIPAKIGEPPVPPKAEFLKKAAGLNEKQYLAIQQAKKEQEELRAEVKRNAPTAPDKREIWNKWFKSWTAAVKKAQKISATAAIDASWRNLRKISLIEEGRRDWYAETFFGLQEPGLFIWDNELLKLMARLKLEPHTQWIGDLPSHAAQTVCKDLTKAIRTMIAERKKTDGRNTGFPRFKRLIAGESGEAVYFPNTTVSIKPGNEGDTVPSVEFPHGVGSIVCGHVSMPPDGEFLGGRVWFERACSAASPKRTKAGGQWWFSAQFKMEIPKTSPSTGREGSVKVAASILATVYDATADTFEQFDAIPEDKRLTCSLKLLGRKAARCQDAATAKAKKLIARKQKQEASRLNDGKDHFQRKPLGQPPKRFTRDYREVNAARAAIQSYEANRRKDRWEQISRKIVNKFDAITIEDMDIAPLMKNAGRHRRRLERRKKAAKAEGKPNEFKSVRKANRRAAMAFGLNRIACKTEEAGKVLTKPNKYFDRIGPCCTCLTMHEEMRDGRVLMICDGCGEVHERRKNAAVNLHEEGTRLRTLERIENA